MSIVHKIEWHSLTMCSVWIFVIRSIELDLFIYPSTTWQFSYNHLNNYCVLLLTMKHGAHIELNKTIQWMWSEWTRVHFDFCSIFNHFMATVGLKGHRHFYTRSEIALHLLVYALLKFISYHVQTLIQSLLYIQLNDIMSLHVRERHTHILAYILVHI